jgi:5-methylcytosine-specific restriction endonuclease McrA
MKTERVCLWCGQPITGDKSRNGKRKQYCNQQHKRNALKARLRGKPMRKDIQRLCLGCGCPVPASRNSGAMFCSSGCGQPDDNRERCRKFRVPYKAFPPWRVFERDGWVCGICKVVAPKDLRGTCHPLAPELDHILPLSLGPKFSPGHIERNCQCAHRSCNQIKSNKLQPEHQARAEEFYTRSWPVGMPLEMMKLETYEDLQAYILEKS